MSSTRVLELESGNFRAIHWPEAPGFGAFWRLARVKAKGDWSAQGAEPEGRGKRSGIRVATERMGLEQGLRRALAREEPVLHYQPQVALAVPTTGQLQALLSRIIKRLMRLLTRQGYLVEEQGITYLADTDPESALAPLQAAACTYRIALGPRAGQKVLSLQTVPSQAAQPTPQRCVNEHGFSLHAQVCCTAHQRKKLEHLCRYITRPAVANERLTLNRAGQVVLTLKTPYRDGTTHIVMSPLEFMPSAVVPCRSSPPSKIPP